MKLNFIISLKISFLSAMCLMISPDAYANTLNLTATYEIPTSQQDQLNQNTFTIDQYAITINGPNDVFLDFSFPEDMLGRTDQHIHMTLTSFLSDNIKVLTGSHGTALCKGPWENVECSMVLKDLEINEERLLEIWSLDTSLTSTDLDHRLQMIKNFISDPIGITKIVKSNDY